MSGSCLAPPGVWRDGVRRCHHGRVGVHASAYTVVSVSVDTIGEGCLYPQTDPKRRIPTIQSIRIRIQDLPKYPYPQIDPTVVSEKYPCIHASPGPCTTTEHTVHESFEIGYKGYSRVLTETLIRRVIRSQSGFYWDRTLTIHMANNYLNISAGAIHAN